MRFAIPRETLLKSLQHAINVIEKRHTMPVLGNFLFSLQGNQLTVTGSDTEVEIHASSPVSESYQEGEATLPGKKLFDIVRALPDGALLTFDFDADRVSVKTGRSKFTLSTLPAHDYPTTQNLPVVETLRLQEGQLRDMIERASIAMAQQDVRFYLNGLLLDLMETGLRCVSTDGHRLSIAEMDLPGREQPRRQIIIPRKGIQELLRQLENTNTEIALEIGTSHIRLQKGDVILTSKLIEGRYPDYEAVIPIGADLETRVSRDSFRSALQRAAILCNDKYKGVKMAFSPGQLQVSAHNPEQEEAIEELEAETNIEQLSVGFNVTYLLEALSALRDDEIVICQRDGNSSALLRESSNNKSRHVVMPMRI